MNRTGSTSRTQTTTEEPVFPGRPRTLNETIRVERDFRPFSIIRNIANRFTDNEEIVLEELTDIDQDYNRFTQSKLNRLRPQTLYAQGQALITTGLVNHRRELYVACLNGHTIKLPIMSQPAIQQLKDRQYKIVHLGAITVAIKGLMRKYTGTKILITILDTRWKDTRKALIALMEVDMSLNKGVFYCCPEFAVSINDLKHIQIGLQSHGFKEFLGGENIALNIVFLGKASNNLTHRYKVQINDLVKVLTSQKVTMLQPPKIDASILAGEAWDLDNFIEGNTMVPEEALIYTNQQNRHNVRFFNYHSTAMNTDDSDDEINTQRQSTSQR